MLSLLWNLSAAIRGYLRFYMPTNRAVDWLRSPRCLRRAIPVAMGAAAAYLYAMSICATIIERGGPGSLNVLVILYFWNAAKFAWMGILLPCRAIRESCIARHARYGSTRGSGQLRTTRSDDAHLHVQR
jgi:hypothetical protein